MPSWVQDFFSPNGFFSPGSVIWNACMRATYAMLGKSPQDFSSSAWSDTVANLYPWFISIGIVLLNLFCLTGFIRQASNLRENVTTEMWVELFIKVSIANTVMVNVISLMSDMFSAASQASSYIVGNQPPQIFSNDVSLTVLILHLVIGIVYFIAASICGFMIMLEVFARFMQIYLLMATAPIALSTWAGGRGFEDTAYAWIKSFLTNTFQIVVIALILRIGGKMIEGFTFMDNASLFDAIFGGAGDVFKSFVTMCFMATAIKGSDGFLKRAFNLR